MPDVKIELSQRTVANLSTGHMGSGDLKVGTSRVTVHFDFHGCRIEAELQMWLSAVLDVAVTDSSYQLRISNASMSGGVVDVDGHVLTPWYQYWNYIYCEGYQYVFAGIADYAFASPWLAKTMNIKQDIISFKKAGLGNLPIAEAVQSFPVRFSFSRVPLDTTIYSYYMTFFGWRYFTVVNLGNVISIDFMEGTASNPTQFVGIQPPAVTNQSLDHIGFGNPYGQFQGHNPTDPVAGQTSIINKMRELGTHSIRFHVPWRDVVGSLTYNSSLNPTNLTETEINNLANDNTKWASVDAVVNHALSNKMDVVLQLAQGHTYGSDQIIPKIQGLTIAPDADSAGYASPYDVFYVNENFYLYQLKLFANAAVKRYANKVGIWTIEGELNAAKLNHLANLWRFGDRWADESAGGFQDKVWGILRDAVRQRDPSAKLSTVFHMLNIVKGLQRFGPDVDIVGVNAYPNLGFATPVLGMAVGELVWATRRALTGLGMGSKEVYVTETNYPGIQASDPPSGISIRDDMNYFSYNRQKQFMADAIESATNYGAKGFFWWMFVAKDAEDNNLDSKTGFGGITKPDLQFKQPASTEFNQKLVAKHPGKSDVQLFNKNLSNQDLGGLISLAGKRDLLTSGSTVYPNRNQPSATRTDQQILQGLRHIRWDGSWSQFRLKEDMIPTTPAGQLSPRSAFFMTMSPVTSVVKAGGVSIPSYVRLSDPWYVDVNGNQPENIFTDFSTGVNVNVFLGQNAAQGNKTYRILTNQEVEHNRVKYTFQNWTSVNATVTQPSSLQSDAVFNLGASVIANYVALKPLPPANIQMVATLGQKVKFTWTEHPDANVTQYRIWRKTKSEGPEWIATVNRGTTNWTDGGVTVSNQSGAKLFFYDIKAYYAPNGSLSDESWRNVTGTGGLIVERPEDLAVDMIQIPESFAVSPYPNPFNPATTFSYSLPENSFVTLTIYDVIGREVAILVDTEKAAGYHVAAWNAASFASGMYLYRFTALRRSGKVDDLENVFVRTGKILLAK